MRAWQPGPSRKTTRWLSREAAELFADAQRCGTGPDAIAPAFDVLIIGSGYGGAVAAAELAGCTTASAATVRVAVLERGREYLPGAFPSRLAELPTHLRGTFGGQVRGGEGLFDIRADGDVSVVQANGLGGGSLINAGVMEAPQSAVFDARWPAALRGGGALVDDYREARRLLGAERADGAINRIGLHPQYAQELPAKSRVLQGLAPGRFREAAITVAMRDTPSSGGVQLSACRRCGDCATGCNHGAKESLDTNLLVRAALQGAEIYCGATALRIRRPQHRRDCWSVQFTHTDGRLAAREGREFWVCAHRVVIAAGALGSTEILLRSRDSDERLSFSPLLGERFSGNGDMIAFGYRYGDRARANAVADEDQPPSERGIGPTITGIVETEASLPGDARRWPVVIEEMAVPGALRRAAEESITTTDTMYRLAEYDGSRHASGHPADDDYAVHRERIRDMSIFASMGDDGAGGRLRLTAGGERADGDGRIRVVWPQARELRLFDAQVRQIDALARAAGYGGRTLANPVWRFLPADMAKVLGMRKGPPVTVHPLGGCPMGDSAADGVVDDRGRVFDPAAAGTAQPHHEGLHVLDGAIVPCALAINPALTIAALALRAIRSLRMDWDWTPPPATSAPQHPLTRPSLRDVEREVREATPPGAGTVVGVSERLAGRVVLRDRSGAAQPCRVELTLTYEPLRLTRLFTPDREGRMSGASLQVRGDAIPGSQLRILRHDEWLRIQQLGLPEAQRERLEAAAARTYAVSGTLTVLQRESSRGWTRVLRAGWAWARNRGVRDAWQKLVARLHADGSEATSSQGLVAYVRDLRRLASHAGEIRRFDYALRIGEETSAGSGRGAARFEPGAALTGGAIVGAKRISYTRAGNPWRQLQELELGDFAGVLVRRKSARLVLDPEYLAERSHPLLRIESQRDHVEALADLVSLGAYFLRMMLSIHIWNARKPEVPTRRRVQRLPGRLPGLPEPDVHWIDVDRIGAQPVRMRLTRYQPERMPATRPPVLLIHGYSASGTTFAHPALQPGLARDLVRQGRDVWVADLRSSAGLATATHPWTMEQVGLNDIPAAVDHIWQRTGQRPIDVVAHCMGAVMLSMAVLSARKSRDELAELLRPRDARTDRVPVDRFDAERRALPQRLRRVVLSQNGPVMVMSQPNIFRAYVMSYIEALFGPLRYDFRPDEEQGLAAQLFDRLLGSLPYPDEDLRRENSPRVWRHTRFVGTRHRMDALYGRTFSLRNIDDRVLDVIDDLFGPLSLDTVAQVIHFSLMETITNRAGRNRFVTPEALQACWTFPTLALHGAENGLADVATLYRLQAVMKAAGRDIRIARLEGQGHQDSLIGVRAAETFAHIRDFLDETGPAATAPVAAWCHAQAPALGPILGVDAQGVLHAGLGAHPRLGRPDALCVLPVERLDGRWGYAHLLTQQGLTLRQSLLPIAGDGDWFTLPLPAWAQAVPAHHALLLLIYASPDLPADSDLAAAIDTALQRLDADPQAAERLGCIEFSALRQPESAPLRLALGSCGYPPGIFNHVPAAESWRRLNARLDRGEGPQLLLLAGDQIYVDATAGMFDPVQVQDRYARPHEAWLRTGPVRDALRRVPAVTMLDDHEIDDNWQPVAGRAGDAAFDANERRRRDGIAHFLRYQRPAGGTTDNLSQHFQQQGVRVFVLDTRTQRQLRTSTRLDAAMLDELQEWPALEAWLLDAAHRHSPKLILSPAAILPRHRRAARAQLACGRADEGVCASLRSDGWDGYPETFYRLLALIADHRIPRVIFLSGDEHIGMLAEARLRSPRLSPRERGVRVLSIHTPGLNTPYRFANAQASELVLDERFDFRGAGRGTYRCAVRTATFAGAGFTWVTLARDGNAWTLEVEFDDGSGAPQRRRAFAI